MGKHHTASHPILSKHLENQINNRSAPHALHEDSGEKHDIISTNMNLDFD